MKLIKKENTDRVVISNLKKIVIHETIQINNRILKEGDTIYINKKLEESMNEKQFKSAAGSKQPYIVFGAGTDVDKQKNDAGVEAMSGVIRKFFPNVQTIGIKGVGRFGKDKKSGVWYFDNTLQAQGHPSNWDEATRGYYASTGKSVFLFPKDDSGFVKSQSDFEANVLGKRAKRANQPNVGW